MKFKCFSKDQKNKLLVDIKAFTDEIKNMFDIDCFICGGVLLGSQREKDFIDHDQDIDLYYISKYFNHKSKESIAERDMIWDYFCSLGRGKKKFGGEAVQLHIWLSDKKLEYGNPGKTNMIDLFGSWQKDSKTFVLSGNARVYECKIQDCILPLQKINFFGVDINAPNKISDFLDFFYGKCWKDSFICPGFPPGEIEQAVLDGVLWEYWRGTKDNHKKLMGFGRKKLGYIKLNLDGTVEWVDRLHKNWTYKDNKIILTNKKTFELHQIGENEYETNISEPYIRIKKINPNDDYSSHKYFNKEICSHWFK